jgi:hypothetical protein
LLFENDVNERGKSGSSTPQGWVAVCFQDRCESGVSCRQVLCGYF